MISQAFYSQLLLNEVEQHIARLREQFDGLMHQEASRRRTERITQDERTRHGKSLELPASSLDALSEKIKQLEQIRMLIRSSPATAQLIDETLYNHYKHLQRRQLLFTTTSNVIFLLLGWFLSMLGTPTNLWQHVWPH